MSGIVIVELAEAKAGNQAPLPLKHVSGAVRASPIRLDNLAACGTFRPNSLWCCSLQLPLRGKLALQQRKCCEGAERYV
eukprot:6488211-Amphidinium_carterae.1